MTLVPNWLLGRHVTTLTITPPLAVGSTVSAGAYSIPIIQLNWDTTSTYYLIGQVDEVEVEYQNNNENIAAMTDPMSNWVPVQTDMSITITEILKNGAFGGASSLLAKFMGNPFYYPGSGGNFQVYGQIGQFIFQRGGGTWTFNGVARNYVEQVRRGKSVGRLQLQMLSTTVDGSENPTYLG